MSIGRLNMSDEVSATSGASPTAGSAFHSVPNSVLLVVKWTYAAPGVNVSSSCRGIRAKFSASVDPAMCTVPTRVASFTAFCAQPPVTM